MKPELIIISLAAIAGLVQSKHEEYDGYKAYRIWPTTRSQLAALTAREELDFWSWPDVHANRSGLVMVPPRRLDGFLALLRLHRVPSQIHTDDVCRYLTEIDAKLEKTNERIGNRTFTFDAYYRYDEMVQYLEELERQHSEHVTLTNGGITAEGRFIKVVLLSTTRFDPSSNKPVIIVEAGINGRGWASSVAALNVVRELLDDSQPRPSFFLQTADWIVVPLLNPDGYEYTHTNLRLWSKSRSTSSYLGLVCPGVAVDRNFDAWWMSADASSSPCSHLYAGAAPLAEPESGVVRDLLAAHARRLALYLSVQGGGAGLLTYPWHHTTRTNPAIRELHYLAGDVARAMSSGEEYAAGSAALSLGAAAGGTSADYAHAAGVRYAYTLRLAEYGGDGVTVPEAALPALLGDVWRAVSRASMFFYMGIGLPT